MINNLMNELASAKEVFRSAVRQAGGKIGVWSADEYIAHWERQSSAEELIDRLQQEASILQFCAS